MPHFAHEAGDVADCGKVFGGVALPPARRSFFVEDWGVEGAAVGGFADWEEGDEFAGEPDYAAVGMVSGELLRVLTSVWMVCWLWWGRSSHLR